MPETALQSYASWYCTACNKPLLSRGAACHRHTVKPEPEMLRLMRYAQEHGSTFTPERPELPAGDTGVSTRRKSVLALTTNPTARAIIRRGYARFYREQSLVHRDNVQELA